MLKSKNEGTESQTQREPLRRNENRQQDNRFWSFDISVPLSLSGYFGFFSNARTQWQNSTIRRSVAIA
jgi:hypothetical protein